RRCECVTEGIESHATGKLRRIAQHQNIAMRVRGDRGQGSRAELVGNLEISEREVVRQAFMLLPVLLQAADGHGGLRGRVWIRKDVIDIDARKAVGFELLEHQARGDGERIVRLDEERQAATAAVGGVDGLLDLEPAWPVSPFGPYWRDGVDEAPQVTPVGV